MSTELDGHRAFPHNAEEEAEAVESLDVVSPTTSPSLHQRQNLAGGSGVFANFFEEMADPQPTEYAVNDPKCFHPMRNMFQDSSTVRPEYQNPVSAFFGGFAEEDDLVILDQYKGFINRSKDYSISPDYVQLPLAEQSVWDGPSSPTGPVTEYFRSDLGSDMCISYPQRCKPPKILGKRFLLGETIGRGSYGKVKDAIDLFTFRRHAVKIINKFGIRKIPGGWSQVLSEAAVMRRLPPSRHVVSLVAVLRLDNPDRLCMVMEHCLGSVHDLQAAGVPLSALNDVDEFGLDGAVPPARSNDRRVRRRFPLAFPVISTTDLKHEARRFTEVFKRRKVSNIEAGRKHSLDQQSQQQFRRLPEAQAHAYFLQLIDGLHFLHQHGVIHRDIKPANLLLTPAPGCGLSTVFSVAESMDAPEACWWNHIGDGQPGLVGRSMSDLLQASRGWLVKLTDFGVSASVSVFSHSQQVSGGQTTPAFQPPEVAKGVQTVFSGPQLDVYSAGVTLYFMLTGRVPFSCQNVLQIFEAIAQGDYVIPGHVSGQAAHLVRKMMLKDPKKRFTLSQVSTHPWVLNNPPSPVTLSDIRARYLSRSLEPISGRGFVYWLEPLEILRRPFGEFPFPHIDDTGARIFSVDDFNNGESVDDDEEQEPESSAGSSSSHQTGVAPLSIVNALKVHLEMAHPSAEPSRKTAAPLELTLEDRLAYLGIHPNEACHPPQSTPIPSTNPTEQPSVKFVTGSEFSYEPPPDDLPIAEPACCLPPQKVYATLAPGGSLRAASFHAHDDFPVNPSSNNNQCTWHAGYRTNSQPMDLANIRFTPRAKTVDSGLAGCRDLLEPHQPPPSRQASSSMNNIHRRLSQWWSNSVLSLRKRFRRRSRPDHSPSLEHEDSAVEVATRRMSFSAHEDSSSTPRNDKRRARMWFFGRSRRPSKQ